MADDQSWAEILSPLVWAHNAAIDRLRAPTCALGKEQSQRMLPTSLWLPWSSPLRSSIFLSLNFRFVRSHFLYFPVVLVAQHVDGSSQLFNVYARCSVVWCAMQEAELSQCTFKPEIRPAPEYIKKLGNRMSTPVNFPRSNSKTQYSVR